jgi:hypothetical protein
MAGIAIAGPLRADALLGDAALERLIEDAYADICRLTPPLP